MGFTDICSFLINDRWYKDRKKDVVDDSERIVKAAAKLIVSQIRELEVENSNYPSINDIAVNNPLLQLFMKVLVSSDLKQNAIGQCIVQAVM